MNNTPIDIRLRRNCLITGLVFLTYVILDITFVSQTGTVDNPTGTIPIIGFRMAVGRPGLVAVLLLACGAYTSFRYWHHMIFLPNRPGKLRRVLTKHGMLVTNANLRNGGSEKDKTKIAQKVNETQEGGLSGIRPNSFVVNTDISDQYFRDPISLPQSVYDTINRHFPGIRNSEVTVDRSGMPHYLIFRVVPTLQTKVRAFWNELDLWLPIVVYGLAVLVWFIPITLAFSPNPS
jgi:hypothetical protein